MISLMEEGLGMILQPDPIIKTVEAIKKKMKLMLFAWLPMERF